jgi:hypothetical protein
MRETTFRRLLWAYPGPYRQRHGTEIVTTMIEMAEAGRGRTSVWQALHLILCGLRQRFRLPAGALVAVAAVLAAVVVGALGATGGTWLGWQTAESMPDAARLRSLSTGIGGDGPEVGISPTDRTAMKGPMRDARIQGPAADEPDRVRRGLIADGWQITTLTQTKAATPAAFGTTGQADVPLRETYFTAKKDGLRLIGNTSTQIGGAHIGDIDGGFTVWAEDNGLVRPITIAGAVAGMLAGWLLAAALAYRIRRAGQARGWLASTFVAAGFAATALPAYDLFRSLYQVAIYDGSYSNPYIVYGPTEVMPLSTIAGCFGVALLAIAVAVAIARKEGDPELAAVPSVRF